MRAEVVAIGTELLLGQIVDTNSSWIGEQLALAGIDSLHQTKVGDNADRIRGAIELGLSRADAVICCGGLGPTQDDITREVIADLMGADLELDEAIADRIRRMFESRGRTMPENNLRQAMVPVGAHTIAQQPGTAPGLVCPVGDGVVYAVPGVPREMREMLLGTVIPELRAASGQTSVIRSRVLRTWGESESGLAERLADRIDELDADGSRTLAFLASGIEGIKVRVTAKADDDAAATAVLDDEEALLRGLLGDLVFGLDHETMEHAVLALLEARGLTLAVAESVTGGMVATRLTDVPGASRVLRGGVVSYASAVKHELLDVPGGPVVSAAAAEAMADGVRRRLGADVGLATTGVAGPDEQEGQPVGTVFLGVALGDEVFSQRIQLPGNREQIRQFSVISLLDLLRKRLISA
ncbi:MAG: competence/damage-inducible protein A [Actinomycetota bacterium]